MSHRRAYELPVLPQQQQPTHVPLLCPHCHQPIAIGFDLACTVKNLGLRPLNEAEAKQLAAKLRTPPGKIVS